MANPRKPGPPCAVCGNPSIALGLCEAHYRRMRRNGHLDTKRPPDWGKRSNHPLWHSWKWTARAGRVSAWNDFWQFVSDVGDRPGEKYKILRRDSSNPFGPDNWYWCEPVADLSGVQTKERRNTYMKAWREKNPFLAKEHDLKKNYGISLAEYDSLLNEQGGRCAICSQEDEWFSLAVDHCHDKKHVRGLLCSQCNRGLGLFKDRPELLEAAAKYLRNPKRLI